MEISILTDHLMIALVAWVGGLALGGGAGYLTARLARGLRRFAALVPWRTALFLLMLGVWSPFLPTRLGLGSTTGIVMVALTIGLVAWPLTAGALLDDRLQPRLRARLVAGARNLLFLALFAALGAGLAGGGGAGAYLAQQVNLMEYGKLLQGILSLGAAVLIMDLILGAAVQRLA